MALFQEQQRLCTELRDYAGLAREGYLLYSGIIDRFAGPRPKDEQLAQAMRAPGFVQIALKLSAGDMLPAAVIYDYPLDTGSDDSAIEVCPAFLKAVAAKVDLASGAERMDVNGLPTVHVTTAARTRERRIALDLTWIAYAGHIYRVTGAMDPDRVPEFD